MKKIKLHLASKFDKKPTIYQSQLGVSFPFILIKFSLFQMSFHLSRDGKTYYANHWKKSWGMPKIGQTIELIVKEVLEVEQLKLEL